MPEDAITEPDLRQIILSHIETAEGSEGSRVSNERKRNLDYYEGEPYGDEREGHSQVITREVMDTAEWILPMLMRIFHGTDRVARFEPVGPEDQKIAAERTDYVNHIYLKDNPGYEISTDVLKSGLVEKNGYWQISWDESKTSERVEYTGLTEEEIGLLMADEEASDVFEVSRGPSGDQEAFAEGLAEATEPTFDVTIRRIFTRKRCKVESVPPEEMVVTARAKSLDHAIESGGLVGRRYTLTRGQLVAMGYGKEVVEGLSSAAGMTDQSGEKLNRYKTQSQPEKNRIHWSQQEILVADVWLRIDFDGDGFAETRFCRLAGSIPGGKTDDQKKGEGPSTIFLENEETDDHPFVDWTPIRKHFSQEGIAVADVVCELQLLMSTLWRQMLDSLYYTVEPEHAIEKGSVADWESVLMSEPGNFKLMHEGKIDAIKPLEKPFVGAAALPVLDKVGQMIEGRTGVSSVSAGLNPDLLQRHAEGTVEKVMSAAQERVGLIARNFAEFGFRKVMLKIAKVTSANQDAPRELRLRGEAREVDPRKWAAEFDVDIDVGLGTGNENVKIALLRFILEKQEQYLLQMGPINPLVSVGHLHSTWQALVAKSDLTSSDPYFIDPASDLGKRNAAIMAEQAARSAQSRQQQAAQILALEAQKTTQKAQEAQTKAILELMKFVFEQDFNRDKLAAELAMKAQQIEAEFAVQFDQQMLDALNSAVAAQAPALPAAANGRLN